MTSSVQTILQLSCSTVGCLPLLEEQFGDYMRVVEYRKQKKSASMVLCGFPATPSVENHSRCTEGAATRDADIHTVSNDIW